MVFMLIVWVWKCFTLNGIEFAALNLVWMSWTTWMTCSVCNQRAS